jgi:SAM-dependent methyltransferase
MGSKKESQKKKFVELLMDKFKISRNKPYVVKCISTKQFSGSYPSSFYDEEYYEKGTKSNYGRLDRELDKYFYPHQEEFYLPERIRKAQEIVRRFSIRSVLCLGCGKGYFVKAFHKFGVEAYGVDISEYAIRNCPKDIRDYLFQGDICDLSHFKTGQFEMVTAINVLEHIAVPDLYLAMDEAIRVSRGYVLFCVKTAQENHLDDSPTMISGDKSHVSIYHKDWWKRAFESRGLQLISKEHFIYPDETSGNVFYFTKDS